MSSLTKEQKSNRLKMLDLLHMYWTKGIFPKNYDYPGRRIPCFIDKDGNICAVGYLIAQTAGREVAERINAKFKYDYLLEMNDKTIDAWVEASGLSKVECAMIQPSYDYDSTECSQLVQIPTLPNYTCGAIDDPVCGCNGVTFSNECEINKLAFQVLRYKMGKCPELGFPDGIWYKEPGPWKYNYGGLIPYNPIASLKEQVNRSANIYPNPVQKELVVEMEYAEPVTISIRDLSGRLMVEPIDASTSTIQVDLSTLQSGQYLVLVQGNQFSYVKSIIKNGD